MDKAEQFLWIVQTVVLANATHLASRPAMAQKYRADISASGVIIAMDEAIRASQMIPANVTATEAADEFCTFLLSNLRHAEERASGNAESVPSWFARM